MTTLLPRRTAYGLDTSTLTTTRLVLRSPRLHPALDGLRLVQIADPHLPHTRLRWGEVVELVRGLSPDLVLHTGDLQGREHAAATAPLLALLEAPLGIYASCGNHDYWPRENDCSEYVRELRRYGLVPLDNETRVVSVGEARLRLIGVGEWLEQDVRLSRALAPEVTGDFTVLLAHYPGIWPQVVGSDVDLVLSGHTHGGQVRVRGWQAFTGHTRAGRRLAAGLFSLRRGRPECILDHWQALEHSERDAPVEVDLEALRPLMYVSRGLGTSTIPIRVNCPPEVVLITLVRA